MSALKLNSNGIPIARARVIEGRGHGASPSLIIDVCPLCGGRHMHGYSGANVVEGETSYGHRATPCTHVFHKQYELREMKR